jgi:Uncharacterized membrane protein (homolog of Drosophila rhomboid)
MVFPVGDDNTDRRSVPVVTFVLIAMNILVFLLELSGGQGFVEKWAFVPARFSSNPIEQSPTLITAMFLHGGWLHLFGNMLYLWIFGDNVEDRLGRVNFLLFYLLTGIVATFAQYAFNPNMTVPNVGASGAIAGVLGAYILMFPQARVRVAVGSSIVVMPAIVVLGLWIALQIFSGVGSIATTDETANVGGIAYLAHVGGFAAGLVLTLLFGRRIRPPTSA